MGDIGKGKIMMEVVAEVTLEILANIRLPCVTVAKAR